MEGEPLSARFGLCCAIFGRGFDIADRVYLVAAQSGKNRITVLPWNDALAGMRGVRVACGAEHTLEIVAHWLTSGSIDLTFTSFTEPGREKDRQESETHAPPALETTTGPHKPIGEIVINRDCVHDILADDPQALASVLDSLLEAMLRSSDSAPRKGPAFEKSIAPPGNVA